MYKTKTRAQLIKLVESESKLRRESENEHSKTKTELDRKARLLSRYKSFSNITNLAVLESRNNSVLPVLVLREDELRQQLEFTISRLKESEKRNEELMIYIEEQKSKYNNAQDTLVNQNLLIKQLSALNSEKSDEIKQFQKNISENKAENDRDARNHSRYVSVLKNAIMFGKRLQKHVPLSKKKKLWISKATIWLQELNDSKVKVDKDTSFLTSDEDDVNSTCDVNSNDDETDSERGLVNSSHCVENEQFVYTSDTNIDKQIGCPSSPDEGLGLSPQLSLISQISSNSVSSDTRTSAFGTNSGIAKHISVNNESNDSLFANSPDVPFHLESLINGSNPLSLSLDATLNEKIINAASFSNLDLFEKRHTKLSETLQSMPSIFDPEMIEKENTNKIGAKNRLMNCNLSLQFDIKSDIFVQSKDINSPKKETVCSGDNTIKETEVSCSSDIQKTGSSDLDNCVSLCTESLADSNVQGGDNTSSSIKESSMTLLQTYKSVNISTNNFNSRLPSSSQIACSPLRTETKNEIKSNTGSSSSSLESFITDTVNLSSELSQVPSICSSNAKNSDSADTDGLTSTFSPVACVINEAEQFDKITSRRVGDKTTKGREVASTKTNFISEDGENDTAYLACKSATLSLPQTANSSSICKELKELEDKTFSSEPRSPSSQIINSHSEASTQDVVTCNNDISSLPVTCLHSVTETSVITATKSLPGTTISSPEINKVENSSENENYSATFSEYIQSDDSCSDSEGFVGFDTFYIDKFKPLTVKHLSAEQNIIKDNKLIISEKENLVLNDTGKIQHEPYFESPRSASDSKLALVCNKEKVNVDAVNESKSEKLSFQIIGPQSSNVEDTVKDNSMSSEGVSKEMSLLEKKLELNSNSGSTETKISCPEEQLTSIKENSSKEFDIEKFISEVKSATSINCIKVLSPITNWSSRLLVDSQHDNKTSQSYACKNETEVQIGKEKSLNELDDIHEGVNKVVHNLEKDDPIVENADSKKMTNLNSDSVDDFVSEMRSADAINTHISSKKEFASTCDTTENISDYEIDELMSEIKGVVSFSDTRMLSPVLRFKGQINSKGNLISNTPVSLRSPNHLKNHERVRLVSPEVEDDCTNICGSLNSEILQNIFNDINCPSPISVISNDSSSFLEDVNHNKVVSPHSSSEVENDKKSSSNILDKEKQDSNTIFIDNSPTSDCSSLMKELSAVLRKQIKESCYDFKSELTKKVNKVIETHIKPNLKNKISNSEILNFQNQFSVPESIFQDLFGDDDVIEDNESTSSKLIKDCTYEKCSSNDEASKINAIDSKLIPNVCQKSSKSSKCVSLKSSSCRTRSISRDEDLVKSERIISNSKIKTNKIIESEKNSSARRSLRLVLKNSLINQCKSRFENEENTCKNIKDKLPKINKENTVNVRKNIDTKDRKRKQNVDSAVSSATSSEESDDPTNSDFDNCNVENVSSTKPNLDKKIHCKKIKLSPKQRRPVKRSVKNCSNTSHKNCSYCNNTNNGSKNINSDELNMPTSVKEKNDSLKSNITRNEDIVVNDCSVIQKPKLESMDCTKHCPVETFQKFSDKNQICEKKDNVKETGSETHKLKNETKIEENLIKSKFSSELLKTFNKKVYCNTGEVSHNQSKISSIPEPPPGVKSKDDISSNNVLSTKEGIEDLLSNCTADLIHKPELRETRRSNFLKSEHLPDVIEKLAMPSKFDDSNVVNNLVVINKESSLTPANRNRSTQLGRESSSASNCTYVFSEHNYFCSLPNKSSKQSSVIHPRIFKNADKSTLVTSSSSPEFEAKVIPSAHSVLKDEVQDLLTSQNFKDKNYVKSPEELIVEQIKVENNEMFKTVKHQNDYKFNSEKSLVECQKQFTHVSPSFSEPKTESAMVSDEIIFKDEDYNRNLPLKNFIAESSSQKSFCDIPSTEKPFFNFYTSNDTSSNELKKKRKLEETDLESESEKPDWNNKKKQENQNFAEEDILKTIGLIQKHDETVDCTNIIFTAFHYHRDSLVQSNIKGVKENKKEERDVKLAEDTLTVHQELCNDQKPLTPERLNQSMESLKLCSPKSVAEMLIDLLCVDNEECSYSSSFTLLTSLQKYLFPVPYLLCKDPSYPDFLDVFLGCVKTTLFSIVEKCMVIPSKNLTRFVTTLARSLHAFEEMRWFMYDVLYMLRFKAMPIVYTMMIVWPNLMPHYNLSKECPLSFCISHVLMNSEIDAHSGKLYKIQELRHLMKRLYGYELGGITSDQVFSKLLTMISKKGFIEAVILLCKREGRDWTLRKVNNSFLPILDSWKKGETTNDVTAVVMITLGYILRPFPQQVAGEIMHQVFSELSNIVSDSNGCPRLQEAAVVSLCRLSRSDFNLCVKILLSWSPKSGCVSESIVKSMKYFIAKRKPYWWQKVLAGIQTSETNSFEKM